jgi:hypothetical protein
MRKDLYIFMINIESIPTLWNMMFTTLKVIIRLLKGVDIQVYLDYPLVQE